MVRAIEGKNSLSDNKKDKKKSLRFVPVRDFSPKNIWSTSMKLVPPYLAKAVEYLLYLKPNVSFSAKDLSSYSIMTGFSMRHSVSRKASFKSKSSIIFDAKRTKGIGAWTGLGSVMGVRKRLEEIGAGKSGLDVKVEPRSRGVSLFQQRSDPWPESKNIKTSKIQIRETPTIYLYSIESRAALEGTAEAAQIHQNNIEYYNRVKTYKKTYNIETQTMTPLSFHRHLGMDKNPRNDTQTQATHSDIFDCYQKQTLNKKTDNMNTNDAEVLENDYENDNTFNKEKHNLDDEEFVEACKIVEIVESTEFLQSFTSLLRMVDKTLNWRKQVLYMKGMTMNDSADKCRITYDLEHLWTLRYVKVWGMPATTLCINPVKTNIIAVGYGSYFMDQPQHLGRVCIWNIKNCSQPEKTIDLRDGVTCVSFSRQHPFALLVSLISGSVKILGISKPGEIEILASCGDDSSNGPIWFTRWFTFDSGNEEPVACGENGVVYLIQKNNFNKKIFLTLSRKESILKGIAYPQTCRKSIPVNGLSVMCLASNPGNFYQYLVGTDDGCVHLCSTDYWHQHTDVFQAHIGPVHHIKYHPDCSKMFLTVGVDNCVRIWAFGVFNELVSLQEGEKPIEDAAWSPVNPNIVVTVSSDRIMIWDLSRVKVVPQSSILSPTGSRFTSVLFSPNGSNIICGDISGDIHVYSLSNFPFLFKNKDRVLRRTLRRLLLGKTDLIENLKSIGHPFDNLHEAK